MAVAKRPGPGPRWRRGQVGPTRRRVGAWPAVEKGETWTGAAGGTTTSGPPALGVRPLVGRRSTAGGRPARGLLPAGSRTWRAGVFAAVLGGSSGPCAECCRPLSVRPWESPARAGAWGRGGRTVGRAGSRRAGLGDFLSGPPATPESLHPGRPRRSARGTACWPPWAHRTRARRWLGARPGPRPGSWQDVLVSTAEAPWVRSHSGGASARLGRSRSGATAKASCAGGGRHRAPPRPGGGARGGRTGPKRGGLADRDRRLGGNPGASPAVRLRAVGRGACWVGGTRWWSGRARGLRRGGRSLGGRARPGGRSRIPGLGEGGTGVNRGLLGGAHAEPDGAVLGKGGFP
jgi:hypothetical protein